MTRSDTLWQSSLDDFRERMAHHATPGCGAAATVSADFGLTLVLKGLRITQSHHEADERAALIAQGEALQVRLAPLADDDVAAFEVFMQATQLPDDDDAEREKRRRAIGEAVERAIEVPLETARACLEGLSLARAALENTDAMLVSDVRGGAQLLHAALVAVLINVDANLGEPADEALRHRARQASRELQHKANLLIEALCPAT